VKSDTCWVEICQDGAVLGAGLLWGPRLVLTALHCLSRFDPDASPLDITFATGEQTRGRVLDRACDADLALIKLQESPFATVLDASPARADEKWRNPYRPTKSHAELAGIVSEPAMDYELGSGDLIEAMQLECAQALGDYKGYSGSPVARDNPDGSENCARYPARPAARCGSLAVHQHLVRYHDLPGDPEVLLPEFGFADRAAGAVRVSGSDRTPCTR
jgi:hypothetical protein